MDLRLAAVATLLLTSVTVAAAWHTTSDMAVEAGIRAAPDDDTTERGPRDAQWRTIQPGVPTTLSFAVEDAGDVAFSMRKRTGAEVTNVELTGMQDCDGTQATGVWISGLALSQPPRTLPVCGAWGAGTHSLQVTSTASASLWAFYIEGASWLDRDIVSTPPPGFATAPDLLST